MYRNAVKILYDFFAALKVLIILNPIFKIIVFINLRFKKDQPSYSNKRSNKNESNFYVIKFKSMIEEKYGYSEYLILVMRLTQFGDYYRKTFLDKITQLINVLKRDMRYADPRPLHVEYLQLYNNHQAKCHDVLAGVLGWKPVNVRNSISYN